MDLADRLGFLVIDETPAVGLFFEKAGLDKRLALCKQFTSEMIDRDKNHPSVIAWSLANEPHSKRPEAKEFFRVLYELAREKDSTRPVTIASYLGEAEEAFEFLDIVCVNRYNGWYVQSGKLDEGCGMLDKELDRLHTKFKKPILLTEFGADAIAGCHSLEPEMWSEEYQSSMIERYITVAKSKPFVVGTHVWNLCDFKTGQGTHRPAGINQKGVFTRDRRPKLAAHRLRELWGENY
jgi:beta-glucuronidase